MSIFFLGEPTGENMNTGAPKPVFNALQSDDRRGKMERRLLDGEQSCPTEERRADSDRRCGVDQRKAARLNCCIPGLLKIDGVPVGDCVIKDMSETGMRIYVPAGLWLPSKFEIEASPFDQPMKVSRSWSSRDLVGVQFLTQYKKGSGA